MIAGAGALAVAHIIANPEIARAARQGSGVIVGVVTTKVAAPAAIRATIDSEVCGPSVPDESIAVDRSGRLANVVVSLAGVKAPAPAEIVIVNERCRFAPRVGLLRPKGSIKMTSRDPVLHTMHAAADNGRAFFNVSLPIPNLTVSKPIDRPGVALLTCSTHTWMRGFLHVTDEASAVSGADGAFRLEGLPPGAHVLKVWHETLKANAVKVTVKDGETANVSIELTRK